MRNTLPFSRVVSIKKRKVINVNNSSTSTSFGRLDSAPDNGTRLCGSWGDGCIMKSYQLPGKAEGAPRGIYIYLEYRGIRGRSSALLPLRGAKRRATNFYGQTFNYPTFFLLELLLKCFRHTYIQPSTGHMHMCVGECISDLSSLLLVWLLFLFNLLQ